MRRSPVATGLIVSLILLLSIVASAVSPSDRPAQANSLMRLGYYVNHDPNSRASLAQHVDQLDVVSPYWYHLTPSGDIKAFAQPDVAEFVKASGAKLVPLIQSEAKWADFHKTLETPAKRDAIVAKLYRVVESAGYDGIQIDFEGVSESDRDLLTDFMTRLYRTFNPRGLIVGQAVIARTSDASSYWGGAYDYRALAEVNDFIVVMAYDYGYAGKPTPSAVAPIWWVKSVVEYAVTRIPRGKLLLGIPFYGYDWNTRTGPPAKSVSHTAAMALASRPGAQLEYSQEDQAVRLRYKDDNGDDHEVWFENAASFEAKLGVMIDYGLGGFATWRLGHEDPADWQVVASLSTPATRIPPLQDTSQRVYFPATGHSLAYGFLEYWRENGGLMRFGMPRTEEFLEFDPMVGQWYTVQYFERARFEWHPEFAGTEYEVLLGHIGRWALAKRGIDPWATAADPIPGARYFSESGHNLDGVFLEYWELHGGLPIFGYPVSEEVVEVNPEDGRTYVVQYFERARFEHHPEHAGTQFEVLLGLLGNEMLRERGWIR